MSEALECRRVAVVGAGVMGRGVAQVLAQAGVEVVLIDHQAGALEEAHQTIRDGIRLYGMLRPLEPIPDIESAIQRIAFAQELAVHDADLVIENVVESWSVKEPLYRALDAACPPRCVFAANTSAIPISLIASATARGPQVLGIHFMNPVPFKDTVEVIRGAATSTRTLDTALELLRRMGKKWIVVNDGPGFVTNRVLMVTINEAFHVVQDGIACAEDVDRIFRDCLGHSMGPLETADLIGLDTVVATLMVLFEQAGDQKYQPCPLLAELVRAGRCGRKASAGVYSYV